MKMVTAVINPYKLDEVRNALNQVDIAGITVTEVKGFGRQKGHTEIYRGAEYQIEFTPKVKLEVVIADEQLDTAVEVLTKAARSGKLGDGKLFVSEIRQAIRIRTGEEGVDAV
jgi:nitrogen regulatory protein PII